MGYATDITEKITSLPLSAEELAERARLEHARGDVETTLDGELVERRLPTTATGPTFQAAPSTWD
ncbi:MAG: hypothetical protein M3320_04265 [Actinomycetota bacterium]|nr:hypothetical protein [Actinomycetota bacterium]